MRRDLRDGFAGHLNVLCREASSDIFAPNRNRPGKPISGNAEGIAWRNGEIEGNWRCGHMMACLTGEADAMTVTSTVHLIQSQTRRNLNQPVNQRLDPEKLTLLWGMEPQCISFPPAQAHSSSMRVNPSQLRPASRTDRDNGPTSIRGFAPQTKGVSMIE
jgi:hypothetical protein